MDMEYKMAWCIQDFPIVKLQFGAHQSEAEEAETFATFEGLLDRQAPFVIIGMADVADADDHTHDPAQRKRIVLWIKRNKARLKSYVKAMIYVEPSLLKRTAIKAMQPVSEKLWRYPSLTAASEEEAREEAQRLLAFQAAVH